MPMSVRLFCFAPCRIVDVPRDAVPLENTGSDSMGHVLVSMTLTGMIRASESDLSNLSARGHVVEKAETSG